MNVLQDTVLAIGEDSLHIATHKIGTLSIHSGAAMVMFLGGCPVFLIMMIGRWSSNVLLCYIRKQIEEFNHDISPNMLTHMFYRHIPNYTSSTVTHLDPRQRNHPNNAVTRINVGGTWLNKPGYLPLLSLTEHYNQMLRNYSFILSRRTTPSHTDPWKYESGGSISFGANGVGQRGF